MSDSITSFKCCSKCKQEFPRTREYFYADNRNRDKLQSQCKPCQLEGNKRHYRENAEHYHQQHREYRERNLDRARAQKRQYYAERAERIRAHVRNYAAENYEKLRERKQRWQRQHPDQRAESHRNRRARKRAAEGTHTAADIAAQLKRQKGKCYWCGKKVGKTYHVDHVHPLVRGGWNDPSNLVIACPVCNLSKGAKLPHEWGGSGGKLI